MNRRGHADTVPCQQTSAVAHDGARLEPPLGIHAGKHVNRRLGEINRHHRRTLVPAARAAVPAAARAAAVPAAAATATAAGLTRPR